jgi:hypothetical protein
MTMRPAFQAAFPDGVAFGSFFFEVIVPRLASVTSNHLSYMERGLYMLRTVLGDNITVTAAGCTCKTSSRFLNCTA